MTDKKTPKAPTHEVFHVVGEDKKARWTKIGVGWSHSDEDGMNLIINYVPVTTGRTVIRKNKAKQEA